MNGELVAEYAFSMHNEEDIQKHLTCCKELIGKALLENAEDYDTAVTLFVMCVNKCMLTTLDKIRVPDLFALMTRFTIKVDNAASSLQQKLERFITEDMNISTGEEYQYFLKYIYKFQELLFHCFFERKLESKTIRTLFPPYLFEIENKELNLVHEIMLYLAPEYCEKTTELTQFTRRHRIQIPYLYGFMKNFFCDLSVLSPMLKELYQTIKTNQTYFCDLEDYSVPAVQAMTNILHCNELFHVVYLGEFRKNNKTVPTSHFLPSVSVYIDESMSFSTFRSEQYQNYKKIPFLIPNCKNNPIHKILYAHLQILTDLYYYEMERKKADEEREIANQRLIDEQKQMIEYKNKLIEAHAHNWEHYTYPNTIKEVADNLATAGDYERAKTLHEVYNSEKLLRNDLTLIQQEFLDAAEKKYERFYDSLCDVNSRYSKKVYEIVEEALRLVLFRLVMKRQEIPQLDVNAIRNSYTEAFMCAGLEQELVSEWFSRCLYPLKIEWNSPLWELPRFEDDGAAYMQMLKIFMNLFHNVLNHGSKTPDSFLKISFDEENINQNVYLTLTVSNPSSPETWFDRKHGKGLTYIDDLLTELNSQCAGNKGVEKELKDNIFTVKLYFSEKLIIRRE